MTHINGHSKENISKIYTLTIGAIIVNLAIYILSIIPQTPPDIKHILGLIYMHRTSATLCGIMSIFMILFVWLRYIPPTTNNIASFITTNTIIFIPALEYAYPTNHIYLIVLAVISVASIFFLYRGHTEFLSTETEAQ